MCQHNCSCSYFTTVKLNVLQLLWAVRCLYHNKFLIRWSCMISKGKVWNTRQWRQSRHWYLCHFVLITISSVFTHLFHLYSFYQTFYLSTTHFPAYPMLPPAPEGWMRATTLQGSYLICLWQCLQSQRLRNNLVLYVPKSGGLPLFLENLEMDQRFVDSPTRWHVSVGVIRRVASCSCQHTHL